MLKATAGTISIAAFILATGCGGAEAPAGKEPSGSPSGTTQANKPHSSALGPITIRGYVHASDGTLLVGASVCSQQMASGDMTDCAPNTVQAEVVVPVYAGMVTAPVSVTCTQ